MFSCHGCFFLMCRSHQFFVTSLSLSHAVRLYCQTWSVVFFFLIRSLEAFLYLIITSLDSASSLVRLQYVCVLSQHCIALVGNEKCESKKKKCLQFIYWLLEKIIFLINKLKITPVSNWRHASHAKSSLFIVSNTSLTVCVGERRCCIIIQIIMPWIRCISCRFCENQEFLCEWNSRSRE